MGRLIVRVLGSVLLMVPAISFALGLGPITMRSSLNQPLDAEIDIHSAQPGDLDGFAVRLASAEDFARVNVERTAFLSQIDFKLKFRNDGSAYIHLTTSRAVTEPYLDFLIEARWPRGRALKEYTVLVDPPVLTAETPKPVEQSRTAPVFSQREEQVREPVRQRSAPQPRVRQQPQQIARPTPPPVRSPSPVPQPRVAETPEGDVDYGRVKRGDTLWEIARDTRPNESVSIHQMMLAYLRDNPEAFIGGNINKLKAGYVLRIEDASTIGSISRRAAIDEVRNQNLAWREGRGTRVVKQSEPEGDSRVSSIRDEVATEEETSKTAKAGSGSDSARLKLVAPGEGEGSGGAAEDSEAAKVKENLLLASEALDATRQETEELDVRMAELDEQLQSMERLIDLKDEELLALQQNLGKKPQQKPAADKQQSAKAKPKAAPKKPSEEDSLIPDELLSDPILLGLAGLLVVAVVGWLVVRRRRMQGGFEESILNVGAAGAAGAAATSDSSMESGPESAMVSDFVMSDMPGAQVDATEVDAISEADVYLAYGRHQQAEDILRQALDKTPDQLELHAKLLEVFHAAKNADAFEEQAKILHEKIGGNETNSHWMEIAPLGREICPHSELFGGGGDMSMDSGIDGVSADEEDLLDFDFDANDDLDDISADSGGSDNLDEALDFDMSSLDMGGDDESEEQGTPDLESFGSAIEEETSVGDDDNSLDFDMSFGEEESDLSGSLEETSLDMDMGSTGEAEDDHSLDFGGLELESDSQEEELTMEDDEAPLELSLDDGDSLAAGGGDDMSLDFDHGADDQGADIVQLDTSGGNDIDLDGELDEDIFSNVDEVGTKLDLAKAYVDMGDSDGARSILDEVLEEGDDTQKQQAEELLQQMG